MAPLRKVQAKEENLGGKPKGQRFWKPGKQKIWSTKRESTPKRISQAHFYKSASLDPFEWKSLKAPRKNKGFFKLNNNQEDSFIDKHNIQTFGCLNGDNNISHFYVQELTFLIHFPTSRQSRVYLYIRCEYHEDAFQETVPSTSVDMQKALTKAVLDKQKYGYSN